MDLTADDKNVILLNSGLSDRALHWLYRRAEILFLPLEGGAQITLYWSFAANCRLQRQICRPPLHIGDKGIYFDTVDDCIEMIGTLGSNAFVMKTLFQNSNSIGQPSHLI